MTVRPIVASMTPGLGQPSGATIAAAPGHPTGETAIPGLRSGVTTGLTRLDHQATAKLAKMCGRMGRREVATGLPTHRAEATGRRMQREAVTDHRTREGATGLPMQHEAETTGPVPHFGETTAVDGRHFVETTGRIRPARRMTATVRSGAMVHREEATGRRTPREAAVLGRLRLGRAARGRAGRAGTTTRVPSGTRATKRAAVDRSRHDRVDVALRVDREAGRHSGQDRLGERVQAANAAAMAEGRVLEAARAVLVAGHQAATVGPRATVMLAAMQDRPGARRIGAEDQAVHREGAADRAGRRATRRDGLVAGRDL